jgi:hypothetical protein
MTPKPLTDEAYREYEFGPDGARTTYRITNPVALYVGTTTHRVVDTNGVVHCVPSVGVNGCVLRWQPLNAANPVQF